jgi:hypothetical protein
MSHVPISPDVVALEEDTHCPPAVDARRSRLAGAVAATHFAISMYILFGGLLVLAGLVPAWAHVPIAVWGVWVHIANWTCPLTPLEKWLRARSGEAPYSGGFVERYILPKRFRGKVTQQGHVFVGLAVLVVNLILYAFVAAE